MFEEFKKFLLRGNVVDLAVGVVIGVAFGAVITSFVDNIINPIIGLIGGQDFSTLTITLKEGTATKPPVVLGYGSLLSAVINFVLVAGAIFFIVVKPLNAINERRTRGELAPDEQPAPTDEALLLAEIRDLLAQRPA